jgi:hypothetical protein
MVCAWAPPSQEGGSKCDPLVLMALESKRPVVTVASQQDCAVRETTVSECEERAEP